MLLLTAISYLIVQFISDERQYGAKLLAAINGNESQIAIADTERETLNLFKGFNRILLNSSRPYPTADPISHFVGFVEGCTNTSVPRWWADSLYKSDKNFLKFEHPILPQSRQLLSKYNVSRGDPIAEQRSGKIVAFTSDDDSVDITQLFIETCGRNEPGHASVATNAEYIAIASYNEVGSKYYINIIKTRMPENSVGYIHVWALSRYGGFSGTHTHRVELIISGNTITIYGGTSAGIYVEQHNLVTLKPILRFSTQFWSARRAK